MPLEMLNIFWSFHYSSTFTTTFFSMKLLPVTTVTHQNFQRHEHKSQFTSTTIYINCFRISKLPFTSVVDFLSLQWLFCCKKNEHNNDVWVPPVKIKWMILIGAPTQNAMRFSHLYSLFAIPELLFCWGPHLGNADFSSILETFSLPRRWGSKFNRCR